VITRIPTLENATDALFVGLQNRIVPWPGEEILMISKVRPGGAGTLPVNVMKAASPTWAPPKVIADVTQLFAATAPATPWIVPMMSAPFKSAVVTEPLVILMPVT
jgi:hypothetical protein